MTATESTRRLRQAAVALLTALLALGFITAASGTARAQVDGVTDNLPVGGGAGVPGLDELPTPGEIPDLGGLPPSQLPGGAAGAGVLPEQLRSAVEGLQGSTGPDGGPTAGLQACIDALTGLAGLGTSPTSLPQGLANAIETCLDAVGLGGDDSGGSLPGAGNLPVGGDGLPGAGNLPVSPDDLPIGGDSLPVSPDDLPVGGGGLPVSPDNLPVGGGGLPVSPDNLPVGGGGLPVGAGDLPVGAEGSAGGSVGDGSAGGNAGGSVGGSLPVGGGDLPVSPDNLALEGLPGAGEIVPGTGGLAGGDLLEQLRSAASGLGGATGGDGPTAGLQACLSAIQGVANLSGSPTALPDNLQGIVEECLRAVLGQGLPTGGTDGGDGSQDPGTEDPSVDAGAGADVDVGATQVDEVPQGAVQTGGSGTPGSGSPAAAVALFVALAGAGTLLGRRSLGTVR